MDMPENAAEIEAVPPPATAWTEEHLLPLVALAEKGRELLDRVEELHDHLEWLHVALLAVRNGEPEKAARFMRTFYDESGDVVSLVQKIGDWFGTGHGPYGRLLLAVEEVIPESEAAPDLGDTLEEALDLQEEAWPHDPPQTEASLRAATISALVQATLLAAQSMEGETVHVPAALREAARVARGPGAQAGAARETVLAMVGAALDLQEGPGLQDLANGYTLDRLREMKRLALDLYSATRQSEAAVLAWLSGLDAL